MRMDITKEIEKTIKAHIRSFTCKLPGDPELKVSLRGDRVVIKIITDNPDNTGYITRNIADQMRLLNKKHKVLQPGCVVECVIVTKCQSII